MWTAFTPFETRRQTSKRFIPCASARCIFSERIENSVQPGRYFVELRSSSEAIEWPKPSRLVSSQVAGQRDSMQPFFEGAQAKPLLRPSEVVPDSLRDSNATTMPLYLHCTPETHHECWKASKPPLE